MSRCDARRALGLGNDDKTALFFGQIAPYKGLEYLISALSTLAQSGLDVRLIIAGKVKRGYSEYWDGIKRQIADAGLTDRVIEQIRFIGDEEVERYFKAADVAVIPYVEIFQSGIPFLAYSFGLPVIATDVGSLRDDVVDQVTGLICRPRDPAALADAIRLYFGGELYRHLDAHRETIRSTASERHSWTRVGEITDSIYRGLLGRPRPSAS
jgi:glycosyltransferase involved in cell wall biosynthesis